MAALTVNGQTIHPSFILQVNADGTMQLVDAAAMLLQKQYSLQ